MMRRRFMIPQGENIKGKAEAVAGDILCAKADGSRMVVSAADYASIPSNWTAIAVVVIPPSHDVYGTGEGAAVSLRYMDYDNPDNGSASQQGIRWGGANKGISNLTNFNVVNYVGSNGSVYETVQGTASLAYLPSDMFSKVTGLDGIANYRYNDSKRYSPSPYNSDGSRNEAYYTTNKSQYNALSDFDGVGNTKILTDLATAQSDWKTATSITNNYNSGYYPAACCSWRYHTIGTNQGDWYLPACGELGYVCVRMQVINDTLQNLINNQLVINCALVTLGDFWSSSEYYNGIVRFVSTNYGSVSSVNSDYSLFVRAFLRF